MVMVIHCLHDKGSVDELSGFVVAKAQGAAPVCLDGLDALGRAQTVGYGVVPLLQLAVELGAQGQQLLETESLLLLLLLLLLPSGWRSVQGASPWR